MKKQLSQEPKIQDKYLYEYHKYCSECHSPLYTMPEPRGNGLIEVVSYCEGCGITEIG